MRLASIALLLLVPAYAAGAPAPGARSALDVDSMARASTLGPGDTVPVREWTVPWPDSRPRDPFADAQGRVWFVGQAGNYIAYLDPTTGKFTRFELDPGVHPHNLVIDAHGIVWYAGNAAAHIGRLDPATGKITKYPMPDARARDPHTLVFAPGGALWFTVQGGNFVGKLDPRSGTVSLVEIPTKGARPYGIGIDSHGHPWFAEFGTNRIGTIDPATMRLREIELPNARSRPRRLEITSDDAVWYGDYSRGMLGRIDPKTSAVREWQLPGGATALPYAMAVDDHDRVWLVETGHQPNALVGFDPKREAFFSVTPIEPSGGMVVRHMTFDRRTGEIWFGTDANTIGTAQVAPALNP